MAFSRRRSPQPTPMPVSYSYDWYSRISSGIQPTGVICPITKTARWKKFEQQTSMTWILGYEASSSFFLAHCQPERDRHLIWCPPRWIYRRPSWNSSSRDFRGTIISSRMRGYDQSVMQFCEIIHSTNQNSGAHRDVCCRPELSRACNHSCSPTAVLCTYWDKTLDCLKTSIRTLRPLKQDEEV